MLLNNNNKKGEKLDLEKKEEKMTNTEIKKKFAFMKNSVKYFKKE